MLFFCGGQLELKPENDFLKRDATHEAALTGKES